MLTIAAAHAILKREDYAATYRYYGRRYPNADYGESFHEWLWSKEPQPYKRWGNGAAMRVSPVGFAAGSIGEVLEEAIRLAEVTHNHPEGLRGAQAAAAAVYLAWKGLSKADMTNEIEVRFGYDLSATLAEIRPDYHYDVS